MGTSSYRNLSERETDLLRGNGCSAEDWGDIRVSPGFDAGRVRCVVFGRNVAIGENSGMVSSVDGLTRPAMIRDVMLANCTIGDNVYLAGQSTPVINYDIGDRTVIYDCGAICCREESAFGNGVTVKAVNEGGGRSVEIYDGLTAQTAYFIAMYRERKEMRAAFARMTASYVVSVKSERGTIGEGAQVMGCGRIYETKIGPYAVVEGAASLVNGTVNSTREVPAYVGANVMAKDFICAPGSRLDRGVSIERCFVGEGAKLDNGFTAVDSLFFANSDCACGEAVSVFAGPFTTSHHRSSLLIAGYFLMFNAGSGSNQSNHLFKTGPVHQGIHERGCKFGSNAYVMLPARDGAFTTVIGRHTAHHDTSDFPYSYLVEEEGRSFLIPAAGIRAYGTLRDIKKWPERDKRVVRRDIVNYEEYNPYIGVKLLNALKLSEGLLAKGESDVYTYKKIRIKALLLKRGVQLYRLALDALLGSVLSDGFENHSRADMHWVDAAGMLAPREQVSLLLDAIGTGELDTFYKIDRALEALHESHRDHAYAWAEGVLAGELGREPEGSDIADAIARGADAAHKLRAMRADDAANDDSEVMMTGYGIDGGKEEDFNEVRREQRG